MIQNVLKMIFGSRNERLLKQYQRQVRAINALEPAMAKQTDAELRGKTDAFRARIRDRLAGISGNADGDAGKSGDLERQRDDHHRQPGIRLRRSRPKYRYGPQSADHSFAVLKRSGRTDAEVMEELTLITVDWCRAIVGRP